MSKAGDLVARMERLGAPPPTSSPAAPAPVERTSVPPARRDRPTRPVRFTVDLDPELHRSLRIFALERRTDATAVVRALVELLDDDMVNQAVIDRLEGPADS